MYTDRSIGGFSQEANGKQFKRRHLQQTLWKTKTFKNISERKEI